LRPKSWILQVSSKFCFPKNVVTIFLGYIVRLHCQLRCYGYSAFSHHPPELTELNPIRGKCWAYFCLKSPKNASFFAFRDVQRRHYRSKSIKIRQKFAILAWIYNFRERSERKRFWGLFGPRWISSEFADQNWAKIATTEKISCQIVKHPLRWKNPISKHTPLPSDWKISKYPLPLRGWGNEDPGIHQTINNSRHHHRHHHILMDIQRPFRGFPWITRPSSGLR
jgi:hypothetical protein